MAVAVQTLIDRARILLQDTDTGGIRWLDSELLSWLNEAAVEIVRVHPEANATNTDLALVAGTRQTIPSDGTQFLNAIRNVDAGGNPGRVVRLVDQAIMNNERPTWHTDTASAVVMRFMFDQKDPFNFYVYPANDGTGKLTIVYSSAPSAVTALNDNFPLPDIYSAPAVNYVCFRAWQKQVGDPAAENRAGSYLNLFNQAMGLRKTVETESDPNARSVNG